MTAPARPKQPLDFSLQLLGDPANSNAVVREMKLVPLVRDDVTLTRRPTRLPLLHLALTIDASGRIGDPHQDPVLAIRGRVLSALGERASDPR